MHRSFCLECFEGDFHQKFHNKMTAHFHFHVLLRNWTLRSRIGIDLGGLEDSFTLGLRGLCKFHIFCDIGAGMLVNHEVVRLVHRQVDLLYHVFGAGGKARSPKESAEWDSQSPMCSMLPWLVMCPMSHRDDLSCLPSFPVLSPEKVH